MLALLYLIVMVVLGDNLCRRFCPYVSRLHRIAAAFLVGLVLSTWITYLSALLFARTTKPLLWGNVLFFLIAGGVIVWSRRQPSGTPRTISARPVASEKWDWILGGVYLIFACWLMFSTLGSHEGRLRIGGSQWSDFGPNLAIMQSFALGHNFPTEYPHYAGERIRYHFLFYFQAGNLEFLGLNPAWSNNLLSILSLVAMLILVMLLGETLFNSRTVGRIGSALCLFNSSLAYIPFLRSQESLTGAISSVVNLPWFLPSGFPYRGEGWGLWTMNTYANQRHLASAIGTFLLVLIFLIGRYREKLLEAQTEPGSSPEVQPVGDQTEPMSPPNIYHSDEPANTNLALEVQSVEAQTEPMSPPNIYDSDEPANTNLAPEVQPVGDQTEPMSPPNIYHSDEPANTNLSPEVQSVEAQTEPASSANIDESDKEAITDFSPEIQPVSPKTSVAMMKAFIFFGILLGALPLWNSAVFGSAFAVLAVLFLMFPLKRYMLGLAIATAVMAIPQVLYLKTGNVQEASYSLFHWGYIIESPTFTKVIYYLGFTFGLKWLLVILALALVSWFHWRVFIAVSSLLAMALLVQFGVEVVANHKFIHIWLIIVNLFAAYGLWRLSRIALFGTTAMGKVAAVLLAVGITLGGLIDLFPIRNAHWIETPFQDDPLVNWVRAETNPKAVFLTDRYVQHPILLAGRRIFFGWSYFAWGLGYPLGQREEIYRRLFAERHPQELVRLLQENGIDYVVVDAGIRQGNVVQNPNESVYQAFFKKVFEDPSTVIFKVPDRGQELKPVEGAPAGTDAAAALAVNMFAGGTGKGPGQFSTPRGIAVDDAGNVLVSDANNGRIQKFSPKGDYVAVIGRVGPGQGELRYPDGITVDPAGNVYVVDAENQRIQKFDANGSFLSQWRGPPPGFYWPRDIAIDSKSNLYVVDQGRDRVVVFTLNGEIVAEWGKKGTGDGEFNEPTASAVGDEKVYVADPRNGRIQVFDTKGNFLGKWSVGEWQEAFLPYPDLVLDQEAGRLYASSPAANEVLVFNLSGERLGTIVPTHPDKLESPTGLAIKNKRLYVLNSSAARVSVITLQ